MEDILIDMRVFFGHIKVDSRLRPEGNRWIGEGRSWHYDWEGKLVKDTGWVPTGVTLCYGDEPT